MKSGGAPGYFRLHRRNADLSMAERVIILRDCDFGMILLIYMGHGVLPKYLCVYIYREWLGLSQYPCFVRLIFRN